MGVQTDVKSTFTSVDTKMIQNVTIHLEFLICHIDFVSLLECQSHPNFILRVCIIAIDNLPNCNHTGSSAVNVAVSRVNYSKKYELCSSSFAHEY